MIRQRDLWKAVLVAKKHQPVLHIDNDAHGTVNGPWEIGDLVLFPQCAACGIEWQHYKYINPDDVLQCRGRDDAV